MKFDLVMYYKIFHGIVSLDISGFFNVSPNNHATRGHDYKIINAPFVNSLFNNLFSTRCVDCWNDVPSEFVNIDSVFSFKKKIACFNLLLVCPVYEISNFTFSFFIHFFSFH